MRILKHENIYNEVQYINKEIRSHKKGVNIKSIAAEYNFTIEQLEEALEPFGYIKLKVKRDYQFIHRDSLENDVRQDVRQDVTSSEAECLKIVKVIDNSERQNGLSTPIFDNYRGLFDKYEVLMNIVKNYEETQSYNSRHNNLCIELPTDINKNFRVTLRINEAVYNEFKEFADNNKQFTIKELVSQALLDFIKKYK